MYDNLAQIYKLFGWEDFTKNLFAKLKPQIIEWGIKSHCDLACGTGQFASDMAKIGISTSGLDASEEMIKAAKKNFPLIDFFIGNMTNFRLHNSVDLITCNYDSINHLLKFSDWELTFGSVYANLANNGRFLFDFNTITTIETAGFSDHQIRKNHSLTKTVYSKKNKLFFELEWLIRNKRGSQQQFKETIIEVSFPFKKIEQSLISSGFKNVKIINHLITNESNFEPDKVTRLYVLAQK